MIKRALPFFIALSSLTFAEALPELISKKVKDHLLIKDYVAAESELRLAFARYPQSKALHRLYILTLAQSGQGIEAYHHYLRSCKIFPDIEKDYPLIEAFCWSILEKGESSSQYIVNICSMIGAGLTQDAKAVKMLKKYLHSSNAYLRAIASEMIARYGDKVLVKELVCAFKKETLPYVKCEMMRSLGRLRTHEVEPFLKQMLFDKKTSLEEKAIAAEALISMHQSISDQELEQLIKSPRAGLRFFACQIVSYLNTSAAACLLAPLLEDTCSEVKIAALNAFTLVGVPQHNHCLLLQMIEKTCHDSDPVVCLTAARLLSFYNLEKALAVFDSFLHSDQPALRRMAASAMGLASDKIQPQIIARFNQSEDPFVKVNLAYSLMGHYEKTAVIGTHISHFLEEYKGKIAIESGSNPLIKVISPSEVRHHPAIPQYPETIDQQTRFHLINCLAMMNYPGIENSIKDYLKASPRGLSFMASRTLLEEGTEDSIEIIKQLLDDKDESIRVQAALVIGMLGECEKACEVLKQAFPKVDREMKIAILEAIGQMGHKNSIPFLMNILDDPFNMLKIIAASSIIQCIYH